MRYGRTWAILCLLSLGAGCGGAAEDPALGPAVQSADVPDPTRPLRYEDVAISVRAGEPAVSLRGPHELDRPGGGTWHVAPAHAAFLRVVGEAEASWSTLHRAMDRATDQGSTRLDLEVVFRNGTARTLELTTRRAPAPGSTRQRLDLVVRCSPTERWLDASVTGGPWWRRHGCEAGHTWSWPWEGPPPPPELDDLLRQLREVVDGDAARLHVRLTASAAEGAEGPCAFEMLGLLELIADVAGPTVDLALQDGGGGRRVKGAVEIALEWLATHQSPDGRWSGVGWNDFCAGEPMRTTGPGGGDLSFDVGATGLALTAFLGAGYTNRGRHPFAKVVSRGAKWLRSDRQRPDGTFDAPGTPWRARNHAAATLALVQLTGFTGNPVYRTAAAPALAALPSVWRSEAWDATDMVLAALAVCEARLEVEDARRRHVDTPWLVPEAFAAELQRACEALTRGDADEGVIAGMLGARVLGAEDGGRGWTRLQREIQSRVGDFGSLSPSHAALLTLVGFRTGGSTWKAWSERLVAEALPAQRSGPACCFGGSWDPPVGRHLPGDRVESTAWFALAHEVYYRYDHAPGMPGR